MCTVLKGELHEHTPQFINTRNISLSSSRAMITIIIMKERGRDDGYENGCMHIAYYFRYGGSQIHHINSNIEMPHTLSHTFATTLLNANGLTRMCVRVVRVRCIRSFANAHHRRVIKYRYFICELTSSSRLSYSLCVCVSLLEVSSRA